MKDTRFGENNNMERLQLLFAGLVMGMPDDQQIIETFWRFVAQKGETWARAHLASMRDGYPTVVDDGEGKEYTVSFRMHLEGDLSLHAANPQEAMDRFLKVAPQRLPIECGFDDCVTVDGIVDEDGNEYAGNCGTVTADQARQIRDLYSLDLQVGDGCGDAMNKGAADEVARKERMEAMISQMDGHFDLDEILHSDEETEE